MDADLLRAYVLQVRRQAVFGCRATDALVQARDESNYDDLWGSVQSFVVAWGNLAKVFWGAGGTHSAKRKPIRDALGVGEESALRNSQLRNNFEHMDERIERWWTAHGSDGFHDHGGWHPSLIGAEDRVLRFFDPRGIIYFFGEPYDLEPVAQEFHRLAPTARDFLRDQRGHGRRT